MGHKQKRNDTGVPGERSGISLRAILVGLVLVGIICFVVTYAELVLTSIQIGFLQMPPAVIGIFFFLVLLNNAAQKMKRTLGLNASELMMIYCMMLVASMISSRGIMEKVIPVLVVPAYFANPANKWQEIYWPHLKKWLVVFDPTGTQDQFVTKRFFEGLRAGESIPWHAWEKPLVAWGILVFLVIFAFLCLASLLRKQWVDNEKLSFSLVQPPIEIVKTEMGQSILNNRYFWMGVVVPCFVFAVNGIHNIYPNLPQIALSQLITPDKLDPPWAPMQGLSASVSFAAVGFFFLLSSDILFSLWFFTLLVKFQTVFTSSLGIELQGMPMFGANAMTGFQAMGAYFVIVGYLLWVGRPHLKNVLQSAFGLKKVDDSQEMMPYKTAFWGLILSLALIVLWCCAAGMSPGLAILEFGVFIFIVAIVMTRSTAEGGMLMTETSFRPVDVYRMFAPVHGLGSANLTMLALLDAAFMRDQRGLLLTGFMDGLKITDGANVKRKTLLPVLLIGIVAAMALAGFIHVWMPYNKGALNLYGYVYQCNSNWILGDYQSHMAASPPWSWQSAGFFLLGVVITIFLSFMRTTFFWWPLHPLGLALSVTWTMSVFWFSCFLAWLMKSLMLHYGGMKLYTIARPFFLGLVLGEFGAAVIWTLISALTHASAPQFPWP